MENEMFRRAVKLMGMEQAKCFARGMDAASALRPQFEASLKTKKLPEIKVMAKATKRSTRGCSTRADFERVLVAWHTAECLKMAGYKPAAMGGMFPAI